MEEWKVMKIKKNYNIFNKLFNLNKLSVLRTNEHQIIILLISTKLLNSLDSNVFGNHWLDSTLCLIASCILGLKSVNGIVWHCHKSSSILLFLPRELRSQKQNFLIPCEISVYRVLTSFNETRSKSR